jgi:hypothetical protein
MIPWSGYFPYVVFDLSYAFGCLGTWHFGFSRDDEKDMFTRVYGVENEDEVETMNKPRIGDNDELDVGLFRWLFRFFLR